MLEEPRRAVAQESPLLTAAGRPRLAVLAVPLLGSALLGAALLGVPSTGRLSAENTSWGTGWVMPMPPVEPPSYDALEPADDGWSGRTWPSGSDAGLPVVPRVPAAPAPPAPPRVGTAGTPTYVPPTPPTPVQRLGPVKHITATVAPGGTVTLPLGNGFPHILCSGPRTAGAHYWSDSTTSAGTTVHRYGGAGEFDFYYRDVTTDYRQTAPCS